MTAAAAVTLRSFFSSFYRFILLLFTFICHHYSVAASTVTGPACAFIFSPFLFLYFYIFIFIFIVILLSPAASSVSAAAPIVAVPVLALDVKMASPPISPPHLYGSSRETGGIFHNCALGSTYNAADFNDVAEDVLHPIPGKVLVYSSNQDPANLSIQTMKPSAFVKHDVMRSIQPVLRKVADKYSPIRSE